jgi:hypothetical protein
MLLLQLDQLFECCCCLCWPKCWPARVQQSLQLLYTVCLLDQQQQLLLLLVLLLFAINDRQSCLLLLQLASCLGMRSTRCRWCCCNAWHNLLIWEYACPIGRRLGHACCPACSIAAATTTAVVAAAAAVAVVEQGSRYCTPINAARDKLTFLST